MVEKLIGGEILRYRGIVLSTALIALFNYGCVKPTDSRSVNQKEQSSDGGQVYNEQPTQVSYDEATTTISQTQQDNIYPESSTTESSYQTQTTSQSGDVYGADSIYSQSGSSTSQYGSGGDIYVEELVVIPMGVALLVDMAVAMIQCQSREELEIPMGCEEPNPHTTRKTYQKPKSLRTPP